MESETAKSPPGAGRKRCSVRWMPRQVVVMAFGYRRLCRERCSARWMPRHLCVVADVVLSCVVCSWSRALLGALDAETALIREFAWRTWQAQALLGALDAETYEAIRRHERCSARWMPRHRYATKYM